MEDSRKIIDEILESAKQNDYMVLLEDFLVEYEKSYLGDVSTLNVSNFIIYDNTGWVLHIVLDKSGDYYTPSLNSALKFTVDEAVRYVLEREEWHMANESHGSVRR